VRKHVLLLMLVFAPSLVFAHRMEVDYLREGRSIKIEAFFPGDGSPVAEASVTVTDGSGRVVAEGTTDSEGAFSFTTDERGPFSVVAERGEHRAVCTIEAAEASGGGEKAGGGGGGKAGPTVRGTRIHREPYPVTRVLAGTAFIFSLAALGLAILVWRRVVRLEGGSGAAGGNGGNAP